MRALCCNLGLLVVLAVPLAGCGGSASTSAGGGDPGDGSRHAGAGEEHHNGDHRGQHSHSEHGDHFKPLHGGTLTDIGHTHDKKGVTHYFAEIMPVSEGRVRFYVLKETDKGGLEEHNVESGEISSFVDERGQERPRSREVVFVADTKDGNSASFSADLAQVFTDGGEFTIVVPKLTVGRERMSFSFSVKWEGPTSEDSESRSAGETDEVSP